MLQKKEKRELISFHMLLITMYIGNSGDKIPLYCHALQHVYCLELEGN